MTKRKPKKSLGARTRNPKTMIEDQPPPPAPATEMIQEEEEVEIQEPQIQNPNNETTIEEVTEKEEEKETVQQSDEITSTNPKLIPEEEEEGQEPETIPEEKDSKSIEKEDETETTTTTDSVSVNEELKKTQSLKMIVEEEEEEEEPSQTHEEEEEGDDEEEEEEEPESMAMSPMASNHQQQTEGMTTTLSSSHAHDDDNDTIMCELVSESPPPTFTTRKSSSFRKRKKPSSKYQRKPLNRKQRAALEVKLQCCRENLQPIPFVPPKTLDFSKHEVLFKRLGLWDFVHIEFDQKIRNDLLSQLIVSYKERSSTVNDLKIKVNRADLGRALKLPPPVKKDKNSLPETMDLDAEVLSEESISFLDEFVSNWFLLHEDMWMMPDEVLNNTRCIKEGQPEKVDWPGLIWFMVEKELSQGPKLKSCYYASHLQYLMRSQRDVLFKEEPKVEASVEIKEENADVERISLEEIQEEEELGNQHIELALGQEKNNVEQQQVRDDDEEDVMDFQECKEPGDSSSQWFLDGKNNFEDHCFRRCNNVVKIDGLDDQCAVKEEEHEEEKYDLSSKCSLEGLTSTDLLQGMGTTNIPYIPSMQLQLLDDNSGELLQTRSNTHMNLGGPSMFGNTTCKRALSHMEEEEEEEDEDIEHDIFSGHHNKRMRNNDSWENKASDTDPDFCLDQINSWVAKTRASIAQKNEVSMNAQMNQQYLMSELQQRDDMIATLHKTKCEEIQRREIDVYKLEHELRMMSNLLVGYRTALKQTQREFSEYRERCPEREEPLYKDVPGGGGLVLSTKELEKQRLEREEEEKMQRMFFEEQMKKFEGSCIATLEASKEKVHLLDKRLLESEEEFKLLKEVLSAKHKMPEEHEVLSAKHKMPEEHEVLSAKHKMPEEEGCIAEEEEEKV